MKRTERRHLKENELAHLAVRARDVVAERRSQMTIAVAAVLVVAAVVIGYFVWRGRVQSRAHSLLAEAQLVELARVGPPGAPGTPTVGLSFPTEREKNETALARFKAVADQYPRTDAGLFARYKEGATQMALSNPKEAAIAYQRVIDEGGDGIYARMSRLGLAEAQSRAGQYEQAIDTYKQLTQLSDGPLPLDGILMQLGRTYLEAGRPADAQQTFNRLIDEFPNSPFSGEAQRELDQLKKT
jgi:tetratricopeptide (TPR) repeat protein